MFLVQKMVTKKTQKIRTPGTPPHPLPYLRLSPKCYHFFTFPQGQSMTMWLEMGPTKIDGDKAD